MFVKWGLGLDVEGICLVSVMEPTASEAVPDVSSSFQ
jgi:hypothetical protein